MVDVNRTRAEAFLRALTLPPHIEGNINHLKDILDEAYKDGHRDGETDTKNELEYS